MADMIRILAAKMGATISALATVVLLVVASEAQAGAFMQCRPNPFPCDGISDKAECARRTEGEQQRCDAVNAAQADWEVVVTKFRTAREEANAAAGAGRWDDFRKTVEKITPDLERLLKTAEENPKRPGAADMIASLTTSLVYSFQNARLQVPMNLSEALREIDRASKTEGQENAAATVFGTMVANAASNAVALGRAISEETGTKARKAEEDRRHQQHGDTTARITGTASPVEADKGTGAALASGLSNYVWGFSERFGLIVSAMQYVVLAFLVAGAAVLSGKAKLSALVRAPLLTGGVAFLVWAINLFLPWVVPYLGPLTVGAVMTVLAMPYIVGAAGKSGLFTNPMTQISAVLAVGIASFIIAFSLPAFLTGVAAAFLAGAALLWTWETKGLPMFGRGSAASAVPMGLDGLRVAGESLHGSARWGTIQDAADKGHLSTAGAEAAFALGRIPGMPAGTDNRFRHMGHVLTCAPTRSGKGVGAVIPNLLEYPGSAVVLDIKGENYAVTARRRRELGHAVYVIDPFGVTGTPTNACNWLNRLDVTSPDCVGEAARLADCLVISSAKSENSHFDETAKGLLQGLMLHVAGLPELDRRHLGELRRLLTLDEAEFLGLMADMGAEPDAAFGVPARAAASLMGTADRERGSILSTARRSTAFLDDPRIVTALSRTDFDFGDLKARLATVYIVIPPGKLKQNDRFLRGFIGSAFSALSETQQAPKHKVAFFLDEFAQLGRMALVEDAISLLSGYGVAFWIYVQDLSQLKGVYPKWQTFFANTAKQFFGTADYDTAKYISDSLGKATIEYETESNSKARGGDMSLMTLGGPFQAGTAMFNIPYGAIKSLTGNQSQSQQFTGRDLLTPDEVMRLGPSKPIVFITGEPAYVLERIVYYNETEYEGQHDANPYI